MAGLKLAIQTRLTLNSQNSAGLCRRSGMKGCPTMLAVRNSYYCSESQDFRLDTFNILAGVLEQAFLKVGNSTLIQNLNEIMLQVWQTGSLGTVTKIYMAKSY